MCEVDLVIERIDRFEAEDFDEGAGGFPEEESRGNDLGLIEDDNGIFREIFGDIAKFRSLRPSSGQICIDK